MNHLNQILNHNPKIFRNYRVDINQLYELVFKEGYESYDGGGPEKHLKTDLLNYHLINEAIPNIFKISLMVVSYGLENGLENLYVACENTKYSVHLCRRGVKNKVIEEASNNINDFVYVIKF